MQNYLFEHSTVDMEVSFLQVRPMPLSERLGGSSNGGGSRSPSIAESGRWKARQAMTPSSQNNVDVTRNGTSSSIDELDQVPFHHHSF